MAAGGAQASPTQKWNAAAVVAFTKSCVGRPGSIDSTQFGWDKAKITFSESALTPADALNGITQLGIVEVAVPYKDSPDDQWSMGTMTFAFSRKNFVSTIEIRPPLDVNGNTLNNKNSAFINSDYSSRPGWPCNSKG